MSEGKSSKFIKLIEIFDEMSNDLNIGRLSNYEKDVLINLQKQFNGKNSEINIKKMEFKDFNGNSMPRSTLYKALKSYVEKV